jgi:hypothetical protein
MSRGDRIVTQEAWGRTRQAAAWPIYTAGLRLEITCPPELGRLAGQMPATIGRKKIRPRWEWSGNLLQVRWFAFVGGVGFGERK